MKDTFGFDLQRFALGTIKKNENFFVEGSGTAVVTGDHGNLALVHLQDMQLDMSSEMEDIFGGESNLPVYSYQTEKNTKVTFTNASMNLDVVSVTQGVKQDEKAVVFKSEKITVPADGKITLSEATADANSLVLSNSEGALVPHTNNGTTTTTVYTAVAPTGTEDPSNEGWYEESGGYYTLSSDTTVDSGKTYYKSTTATVPEISVDTSYAGSSLEAFYDYTVTAGAIGTSVLTTSVPGYVTISHRSKPMKQKNGRVIRIYTKIYRARCDGTLKIDFKHKEAFAPELTFNMVDPERQDKKYISFTVRDCTDDPDLDNMISPV